MSKLASLDNSGSAPRVVLPRDYNAACEFVDANTAPGRRERTAIIDNDGSYTYAELAERVNRAGNALLSLEPHMETRIMLCMLDSVALPAMFWGAIKCGAVPIPVNTMLTTEDYDYMLRDSRARVLVISDALYDRFAPVLRSQPHLRHIIVVGDEQPGTLNAKTLLAQMSDTLQAAPTTSDDVAFWLYTSGSTGTPKGSMHLHGDLIATAMLYGEGVLGLRADDVVYSAAKLFFAYGLGNGMSFPMYAGATAVLLADRPTPDAVMALMKRHQPSIFYGVPTLYGALLADSDNGPQRGSQKLRMCVSAGEALPEGVAQRWQERFGVPILDGLGSTEMLHIFLSNTADDIRYGSSGKCVPGYELKLVDEHGNAPAVGELGELWVKGPSSAVAYWNQRAKSLDTFQGPWTRTGDKYTVDADGYYHYSGRTDDMLKVSGQWVSPFEVESALLAHEDVLEAAVVGQPDDADLIKPKAFVVLKDGVESNEGQAQTLQAFVKERLAKHKYPRWIEFASVLPKTATGKIQRYKLR